MKKAKVLCLILATLMLLSLLVSCGDDGKKELPTEEKKEETSETIAKEDRGNKPDTQDLGGYVYTALVRGENVSNKAFYCIDFDAEKNTGDYISQATYERNELIKEDYNVVIEMVSSESDQLTQMKNAYAGGTPYELAILRADVAAQLAVLDVLYDLNSSQISIDLEKDCFDQNANAEMSMGGSIYYITGDMNLSTLDNAAVTIFNKSILASYPDMEDPYALVESGKWTIDKMIQMATDMTTEVSGEVDVRGFFPYASCAFYYYYGSDARISTLDEDGYPELTFNSSHSEEVISKIYSLINITQNPIYNGFTSGADLKSASRLSAWSNNKVAFTDLTLWDVRTQIRSAGVEYGILPIAKYDEAQKDYKCLVYYQDCVHLWTLPKTCTDKAKASLMIEVFASYSTDTTMDTYYNRVLSLKSTKDEKSQAMLDKIRSSLTYDIELLYDWGGGFARFMRNIIIDPSNGYSGMLEKYMTSANKAMTETLDGFRNPMWKADSED